MEGVPLHNSTIEMMMRDIKKMTMRIMLRFNLWLIPYYACHILGMHDMSVRFRVPLCLVKHRWEMEGLLEQLDEGIIGCVRG
jgi:hypothetical protein